MSSIQLKIEIENAIRRVSVSKDETLAQLKATVTSLCGLSQFDIKYRDEENDLVTIGSDEELKEVLSTSLKSQKNLRLIVTEPSTVNFEPIFDVKQQSQEQQEPKQPKVVVEEPEVPVPWINLARALSDTQAVEKIQHVLQSPILTEAIARVSRAYVASKGDLMMSGLVASQQIPMLLGVLHELLEELPILKDLQVLLMSLFANGMTSARETVQAQPVPMSGSGAEDTNPPLGGTFGSPFGGPFGRGGAFFGRGGAFFGRGHHQHPQQPYHQHLQQPYHQHPHPHHHAHHAYYQQKHPGVFCDGCGSDDALKNISISNGHQTRRGFINGVRYQSQTINDFDLCESCKNSGRFNEGYGPFTEIEAPPEMRGGRGGRGGGWWQRGDHHQRNWRQNENVQEEYEEAEKVAEEVKPTEFDFIQTIRAALSKGSEVFAEAAKQHDGNNDFSEIARAIAESLKTENEDVKNTSNIASTTAAEHIPVNQPVVVVDPQKSDDPFVKWASQLSQLQTLGFENLETYIEFLEEEKGDLDRVVNRIVRRDS